MFVTAPVAVIVPTPPVFKARSKGPVIEVNEMLSPPVTVISPTPSVTAVLKSIVEDDVTELLSAMPPLPSLLNVTAPVLASPTAAPMVNVPVPALKLVLDASSAVKLKVAPSVSTAKLILRSLPARKLTVSPPVWFAKFNGSLIIRSRSACRSIFPVIASIALLSIVISVPSAGSANKTVPSAAPTSPLFAPPDATIVRSCGSSKTVPAYPLDALTLTVPSNAKCCLPETSTKPPSPDSEPAFAVISPK